MYWKKFINISDINLILGFLDIHAKHECVVEEDASEWHDKSHPSYDQPIIGGWQLTTTGTTCGIFLYSLTNIICRQYLCTVNTGS